MRIAAQASMEPRSVERGNTEQMARWHDCGQRFNGATLSRTWKPRRVHRLPDALKLLQWSHAQSNVETDGSASMRAPRVRCFNGATLSRTWKHGPSVRELTRGSWLQWSHAQSNVETIGGAARSDVEQVASMEPRSVERGNIAVNAPSCIANRLLQWSHAQSNVETLRSRLRGAVVYERFNGATLSRTWKPPEFEIRDLDSR